MRRRPLAARLLGVLALSAAASLAGSAVAAPPVAAPPAAAPAVVPPRLDPPPVMPYPKGAQGDADVTLVLTIAKDGQVRSAEVETGAEPFASAAKEAAASWHFEPATREGRPIATRIRFAVTFHGEKTIPAPAEPEPPEAATKPLPGAAPAAAKAPPKKVDPIEILIRADKLPPAVTSLSRAEVRQIPGTFGDPFRAIEIMPGVTPVVSGLPFFYIRGAPPGNVGYYLDGVRVPYLFHIAIGPSVVNPALVERVDLYSGGYPAQYGRYAGAIVSAETTAPRDDFHGEGNLRVFDAGAVVESGFANGRGTAMVGGRYSYTGAVISLISPEIKLDYRDYQARITWNLTPRDQIGLFAFGSYDLLAEEKEDFVARKTVETIVFGSEFYRFDLRYDHRFADGGTLRWATTAGFDQTRFGAEENTRDVPLGTRLELTHPLTPELTLRAGLDAQFDSYGSTPSRWSDPDDPTAQTIRTLFSTRSDAALSARGDLVWKLGRRVTLTPGLRFDLFRSGGSSAVSADGRVGLRAEVTDKIRLIHAVGLAHQPPSFIVPLPGVNVDTLRGGLQTSVQSSAGIEVDLPDATTASVNVFDNVFLDMSDTLGVFQGDNSLSGRPDDLSTTTLTSRSQGSAYGLEVYVRRRLTRRLGGFLSYTLSRSSRTQRKLRFPSAFDRTHVLNAAAAFDIGRGWRAGARFVFYTGTPTVLGQAEAAVTGNESAASQRGPAFYRIDLRVEKRWTLQKSRWISFVAEMMNTTLRKESINNTEIGPIAIPSIGVEGGF